MSPDDPPRPSINRHVLLDTLFLRTLRAVTWRSKYFRDGIDSAPFDAHLEAIDADWPTLDPCTTTPIDFETLAGTQRGVVAIKHWQGPDAPTLIWHHGGGEHPYDSTFDAVYPDPTTVPANLFLVRAPGHDRLGGVQAVGRTLQGYLAMQAVAVALTERIRRAVAGRVVVAGYSLGGFVTGLHHAAHDSADAYVPLMAGTAHAEIFLTTVPAAQPALDNPGYLRDRLNFTRDWRARTHDHVHPILGRYDRLNRHATQAPSYPGVEPENWPVGHLTGLRATTAIRRVLEDALFAAGTADSAASC
jgi:predicted alpha/beta-hydrolase family hydrolase